MKGLLTGLLLSMSWTLRRQRGQRQRRHDLWWCSPSRCLCYTESGWI